MSRLDRLYHRCQQHNLEVWHVSGNAARIMRREAHKHYPGNGILTFTEWANESGYTIRAGWYWWTCCPGCLPDSDPFGPFTSPTRACEDALEGLDE